MTYATITLKSDEKYDKCKCLTCHCVVNWVMLCTARERYIKFEPGT